MSRIVNEVASTGPWERPTYQWEIGRDESRALRLFGTLGRRELARVLTAMIECGRSPRDFVCVDFEGVEHLDYRALPEFTAALLHLRNRGALTWFVGMSPYVRSLFQVAGQGSALGRLEWRPEVPEAGGRAERDRADREAARANAWSKTGI